MNWIENLGATLSPHVERCAAVLDTQFGVLVKAMDRVELAVRESAVEPAPEDLYFRGILSGSGPNATRDLGTPAPGEMWVIESVAWCGYSTTASDSTVITVGGQPVFWCGSLVTAGNTNGFAQPAIPVRPGERVILTNSASVNWVHTAYVIRRKPLPFTPLRNVSGRSREQVITNTGTHESERELVAGFSDAR